MTGYWRTWLIIALAFACGMAAMQRSRGDVAAHLQDAAERAEKKS